MARNIVKRDQQSSGAKLDGGAPVDKAPMRGGTSGAPSGDPNVASMTIRGINDISPARTAPEEAVAGQTVAKKYEVIGGPDFVMYEGCRTRMLHGKIYTEAAVDIDLLLRQGVKLREVVAE